MIKKDTPSVCDLKIIPFNLYALVLKKKGGRDVLASGGMDGVQWNVNQISFTYGFCYNKKIGDCYWIVEDAALSTFITCDVIIHCYSSRNKSVPYV